MKNTMLSNSIFRFSLLFLSIFLLGGIYIVSSDEGSLRILSGSGGRPLILGFFESEYGNFGSISFDEEPVDQYRAHMNGTTLDGYFWSQAAGWMYFTGASISPAEAGSGVRERWVANGYIWSDYAGYTSLSDVSYFPDTASLTGWAWSENLGWLSLQNVVNNVGLGFIGRVKIIGNIGSKSIYDVNLDGYNQQGAYLVGTVTDVINEIKKDISVRMRNADNYISFSHDGIQFTDHITRNALDNIIYYSFTGSTGTLFLSYSDIENKFRDPSVRTIVVIGGDIFINTGILLPNNSAPHAIIALKNLSGIGGNIYINSTVTNIESSLISEGSIYSGKRTSSDWFLFNRDKIQVASLPNYQLYIRGSVISRNTIGGAGVIGASKCPFTEMNCTYDQALRYDFNYFRDFQSGALDPNTGESFTANELDRRRGYPNETYDDKSFIIEYDPRIVSDPPPGL